MAEHRWETARHPREPDPAVGVSPDRDESTFQEPSGRRRWAFTLPAAVLAVCLLIGCGAAVYLLRDRGPVPVASVDLTGPAPSAQPDAGASGTPAAAAPYAGEPPEVSAPAASSSGAGAVVVHVAGAVQRPGVVRLPAGSRIVDAVDAAGGTAADADLAAVNLAAVLVDGAMVLVPRIGDPALPSVGAPGAPGSGTGGVAGAAAGAGGTPGAGALINLNTADSAQLQELPRVGPVLAERIIAWRSEHGSFSRAEDLDAVPGIGEAMMAALLPLVTV